MVINNAPNTIILMTYPMENKLISTWTTRMRKVRTSIAKTMVKKKKMVKVMKKVVATWLTIREFTLMMTRDKNISVRRQVLTSNILICVLVSIEFLLKEARILNKMLLCQAIGMKMIKKIASKEKRMNLLNL